MAMQTLDVWQSFAKQLQLYILGRVNQPEDAEDLLQDVFVKIHMHLETLEDEEYLVPWLYRITRNTIIDYYRSRLAFDELPEDLSIDHELLQPDLESRLAEGLRDMVMNLPAKYRQALILTEFEGFKQTELASELGISISGAKSRVQRGRALLKQELFNCCHFEFDLRGNVVDYIPKQQCCPNCTR